MMQPVPTPVSLFIKEHELTANDGVVHFTAIISFHSKTVLAEIKTEVVITKPAAGDAEVIHLLNPFISENKIPHIINSDTGIMYQSKHLFVPGYAEIYGQYELKIYFGCVPGNEQANTK